MEEKVTHKRKLRDLTLYEFQKWKEENCYTKICCECIFEGLNCLNSVTNCWVNKKEKLNDEFLNQEVEIKEDIEIEYLSNKEKSYFYKVIGVFGGEILTITKKSDTFNREYIEILYLLDDGSKYVMNLCPFEKNTKYKNMELDKEYTLKELGLLNKEDDE